MGQGWSPLPCVTEGETKSREGRNLPKAQGLLETGLGVAPDPGEDGGSQGHGWGLSLAILSGHWNEGSGQFPHSPAKEGWREASCL